MAAAIKQALGVEPKLVRGAIGDFEIVADGKLVFSKQREGRFPEEREILGALKT